MIPGDPSSSRSSRSRSPHAARALGFVRRARFAWLALMPLACGAGPGPAARTAGPAQSSATAPTAGSPALSGEDDAAVPISTSNPTWGSRTAFVTIVEFADFECPFCVRVEATLASVREVYGPDTVRIVWKNSPLPFHPNARPAAEAAAGVFAVAGNDAFWKFHDAALHDQGSLGPKSYEQWASDAGVADLGALRSGLERHVWASAVDKDADLARDLGASGTPTFFVNGLPLTGALPFPTFQVLIDEQVLAAKAKIAAGTPRDRLYTELAKDNRARLAARGNDSDDSDSDDDDSADSKTIYKVPVGKSATRGPPAAPVTLVEFADYECPFCARVEPTMKALRDEYGDKLRVVFKDMPLPFHPRAEPAAEAALEVRAEKGDAAFWAMHDELLAGPADLSDETLVQLAARFGARAESVKKAIANHTHRTSIEEDEDLAEDVEANGTPHFFVNGQRLVGAQPKEKFKAVIEEQMARAEGLIASGTRPDAVYDALVSGGKGAVEPEKKAIPVALAGSIDHAPHRGDGAARVTVHEWSDFQCPFCKRVEPTLERVTLEYGARVRLVWHDLPLPMHPDAPLAARAAREALAQKGQRAFWTMHDQIFAHQPQLKRDDLDGYARGLGLDMGKWSAALDGSAHQAEIDADRDAAADMSIVGTPTFVVVPRGAANGYFIRGAQGYTKFRKLIERSLAEAK
jgi:protein-disulfide isomerase